MPVNPFITQPLCGLKPAIRLSVGVATLCASFGIQPAYAGTHYLPLQISPEVESRVERLFILAGMPVIKRPIAVNDVINALDKVGSDAPLLTQGLRIYLERFNQTAAITHLNAGVSAGSNDSTTPQTFDNQRGLTTDDRWHGSFAGYWVLNDFVAVNVGARVKDQSLLSNKAIPEGSFISIGWDTFQADIGYRAHWFSPFQETSLLLSTNVESLPGITFSNSEPYNFFNLRYEVALMRMSESDAIESAQDETVTVSGYPKLLATHISLEPFAGFSIGLNRLMQFGGGNRGASASAVLETFFEPSRNDARENQSLDFANPLTAINARYSANYAMPFAVYFEYAGEDSANDEDLEPSNTALMLGVHLPQLPYNLDVTIESAQWKNGWYASKPYGDGLTHFGNVTGHWAANYRLLGDTRGLSAHVIKVIWDDYSGTALTGKIKSIANKQRRQGETNGLEFNIEVAHAYNDSIIGLTLTTGKNVLDENYSNISGFIRW